MKALNRNKTTFYYCLYQSTQVLYDTAGYETGEKRVVYGSAVAMKANVSAASGVAQSELFGSEVNYDKVIVTDDINCPIDENAVLFVDKAVAYDSNGNPLYDYVVDRVAKSLNGVSIAIRKVKVS